MWNVIFTLSSWRADFIIGSIGSSYKL